MRHVIFSLNEYVMSCYVSFYQCVLSHQRAVLDAVVQLLIDVQVFASRLGRVYTRTERRRQTSYVHLPHNHSSYTVTCTIRYEMLVERVLKS